MKYYSVIVRMNGDIVGSPEGIPCHSLEQAKSLAKEYRTRGDEFKMTEVVIRFG